MIAFLLAPIYLLVNFYILRWLFRFLAACFRRFNNRIVKNIAGTGYLFLCTSPLIAFFIPLSSFQRHIARISNYWLGIFLYIFLTAAILELFHIAVKRSKTLQRCFPVTQKTFIRVGTLCVSLVVFISFYGIYEARNIKTTTYNIEIESESYADGQMKVVLIADLHMGYSIGYRQIEKMVDKINEREPDLVCIAGDIFDNHYESLDNPERIKNALQGIQSRYGVYACYGNHDYEEKILAGFTFSQGEDVYVGDKMKKLLEDADIQTLEDEAVLIHDQFYVVGRKDYSSKKKSGIYRKTPEELIQNLDKRKPILVIDHQPRELEELTRAGVDLDLCGLTHDGQMFPGNLLTDLMWENSYGYLKKGEMHNIVTSGVGIFGPYMRVGTKSEIVEINIDFH